MPLENWQSWSHSNIPIVYISSSICCPHNFLKANFFSWQHFAQPSHRLWYMSLAENPGFSKFFSVRNRYLITSRHYRQFQAIRLCNVYQVVQCNTHGEEKGNQPYYENERSIFANKQFGPNLHSDHIFILHSKVSVAGCIFFLVWVNLLSKTTAIANDFRSL